MDKLLILDDEPGIAATVAVIAESAGFAAISTTDATEFFSRIEEWQPTHIALDLVMPNMDGVQVLARLAELGCTASIIITSGVGSRVLDAAGRSATGHGLRIAGMLAKPFTPAMLRALLLSSTAGDDSNAAPPARPPRHLDATEPAPTELRAALDGKQLFLDYQPQIAAGTLALAGFEALVRWNHPERGIIPPDRFIPMAESAGLINELTDQVLDMSLAWLSDSFPVCADDAEITMSINISPASLGDHDFLEQVLRACERHRVDPSRVILELTESCTMHNPIATLDQLTRMRMKGFQLSIDDFGTGFSSILQLARLPFSELKIDKSFVMTVMHSIESRAVVRSVAGLGHSLGLRVVAEGVEDGATLEFLKGIGCDVAQGFFIARPMPGEAVAGWLAGRQEPAAGAARARPWDVPPEEIESFQWDDSFITGLADVDHQHQRLVELINRLGQGLLGGNGLTPVEVNAMFAELVEYTNFHFREEETLMDERALDPRHIEFHREEHARFITEVLRMRESKSATDTSSLQPVFGFLVHWLAYHILGVDQSMARQVAAIEKGSAAAAAFEAEVDRIEGAREPLVKALHGLLRLLSRRNHELRESNLTLESRVSERTEALSSANRQLAMVAMTDTLTGIPNRRHAIAMLGRAWEEARVHGQPLACLMIDADHLKAVNDQYGHDAGDEVIKGVAVRLQDAARSDDIVCRLGGDEFLVVAPDTPLDGALRLAEKIRREVTELRIATGAAEWQGSVSIGVAVRDSSMATPEALIKAADEAIYDAKRAGRNTVASYCSRPRNS